MGQKKDFVFANGNKNSLHFAQISVRVNKRRSFNAIRSKQNL